MSQEPKSTSSVPLVALVSWLIPGAGYWMIGERARAVTVAVTVIVLFGLGLLIAGVRVIDVPGYDQDGKMIRSGDGWVMTRRPLQEIATKPWFVGQILVGPICVIASKFSLDLAESVGRPHARLAEIGTLYTAVAGMLNLLTIIDAAHRASHRAEPAGTRGEKAS